MIGLVPGSVLGGLNLSTPCAVNLANSSGVNTSGLPGSAEKRQTTLFFYQTWIFFSNNSKIN